MSDVFGRGKSAPDVARTVTEGNKPHDPLPDLFNSTPKVVNSTIVGRSCPCGNQTFILRSGEGPHANGLECASCGAKSWLRRDRTMSLPLNIMQGTSAP
jgi:hypothetical protein